MIIVNQLASVNVNYEPGLYVGMTVIRDTGSGPVQVGSIISMVNVTDSLYIASITPTVPGAYTFRYAVYTDVTHTVLSDGYGRGSVSEQVIDLFSYLQNLDVPVSSRLSSLAYVAPDNADIQLIKSQTDQMSFTAGNIDARANVVADKTGYSLSSAEELAIADKVWSTLVSAYTTPGEAGFILSQLGTESSSTGIANAVWNSVRSSHSTAGSFGEAIQGVITSARANGLDFLDVLLSTRASQSSLDNDFGNMSLLASSLSSTANQISSTEASLSSSVADVVNAADSLHTDIIDLNAATVTLTKNARDLNDATIEIKDNANIFAFANLTGSVSDEEITAGSISTEDSVSGVVSDEEKLV